MSNQKFEKGREGFADGTLDWDTNTFKYIALDAGTADAGIKAVTGATNATPIVLTITANGFANGDLIVVGGVGGNLAANGTWRVANQTTNTVDLVKTTDGGNSTGSGAYTSGGYAICLGPSAAGDNLDDFSAARVGTDVTMASPTVTAGVIDSADPTWTALTGATVEAVAAYKDTGAEATSRMVFLIDGKMQVIVAADAASSATTLWVEPLSAAIPNSTAIVFSNGVTATLTAGASQGARSLTVSALPGAIAAGNTADVTYTGSNFPFTPNGGNFTVQMDNGSGRIMRL